ncbi:GNAT family N-acetyltransferase [Vibrio sp. SCSIO 43137]|uniref:GNAT family N-acetyltransferase n=1 Tax=Vibrio sp. SCSIO 43137 TaxID=3021011 RepID=UPI002307C359|nr:GNAT family N-acetyltransferase [Vibrio sp. SCSIO 43137]WCE32304.1 GNAT family N-acetyltransferase [Vibrio sp. SCSIO 43137]
MRVEPVSTKHVAELFEFEKQNKLWFEKFVPARPASYRNLISFRTVISDLVKEQQAGCGFFFVIIQDEKIVGRINLIDVEDGEASLGYRIAESVAGKGVASQAVKMIKTIAREELGLTLLNATAAKSNPASARVLEKSDFEKVSTEKSSIKINGEALILDCFELKL